MRSRFAFPIVLAAALALAASASLEIVSFLCVATLALVFGAWRLARPPQDVVTITPLSASVLAFAIWMVGANAWNVSYSPMAPYHAGFLLAGFMLGRRAWPARAEQLFAVILLFGVVLAIWGVWQRAAEGVERAHALFRTPAILAAALNLVFLPAMLLAANLRRSVFVVAVTVLTAALLATTSRGGWIALGAGALAAFALARRLRVQYERSTLFTMAGALAAGWMLWWIAGETGTLLKGQLSDFITGPGASLSAFARFGLYDLALHALSPAALPSGLGYLSFYYVLEGAGKTVPGYEEATTYFVHNDYLQMLLELGLPGLACLAAVVAVPLACIWQSPRADNTARRSRVALAACGAAMTSMAMHALMDFPFYVPVCVLIYGMVLGVTDAVLLDERGVVVKQFAPRPAWRALSAAFWSVAAWVLMLPAVADAAAFQGGQQMLAGRVESAAWWFEAARRIDSRDPRQHFEAGRFWALQAIVTGTPDAAIFADRAFAAGHSANPREVRNLVARISLHRQLRKTLPAPADAATLRAWTAEALVLAPEDARAKNQKAMLDKEPDK